MRPLRYFVLTVALVVFLPLDLDAEASGPIYLARQIPEGTEIKVDGDLGDWQWTAPVFSTSEDFPFSRWDVPKDDFGVEVKVAWSGEQNRLYLGVKVTDDQLCTLPLERSQQMWNYDLVEVFVDADGSGGNYRGEQNSRRAQQYYLYLLPDGKTAHLGLFGPEEQLGWSLKPPYAQYAASYDDKTICYELAMNIWDWLDSSLATSRLHHMEANQLIGWKVTVKDRDDMAEGTTGCTLRPTDAWENADNFAELMLMP